MKRLLSWCSVILLSLGSTASFSAESSGTRKWEITDMVNPGEKSLKDHLKDLGVSRRDAWLRVRLDGSPEPPADENCDAKECFRLFYNKGRRFNKNDVTRKNILLIPGGPGDIFDPREQGLVLLLEDKNNVIYFDPRGTGLSLFGGDGNVRPSDLQFVNSFDRFLRADFIVRDIEQIRRAELGPTGKWHAIYGHSYGTVIAQQYAKAHPDFVERLILSAPVARHIETGAARIDRVLRNLDNIYSLIVFKNPAASCVAGDTKSLDEARDVMLKTGRAMPEPELEKIIPLRLNPERKIAIIHCNDDFSFLRKPDIRRISSRLKDVYEQIEKAYGSASFLIMNFDKVENELKERFPYPKQFFIALSEVQRMGAPDQEGNFYALTIGNLVRVGMVLGYYSMFDLEEPDQRRAASSIECKMDAPFLDGLSNTQSKQKLCHRIKLSVDDTKGGGGIESRRALYVLGLYDGIFRWVFRLLDDRLKKSAECPNGFLTGRDLLEFTTGTTYKMLRNELSRVGVADPEEPMCAWDPGRFRHGRPTLFLKGGADAVIAGGQPEEFFNNGLIEPRQHGVLIEFPGLGHDLQIPLFFPSPFDGDTSESTVFGKAYVGLLTNFLSMSISQFRQESGVKAQMKILGARDVTP